MNLVIESELSPHTWGKHFFGWGRLYACGAIPTHVGQMGPIRLPFAALTSHPHSRGAICPLVNSHFETVSYPHNCGANRRPTARGLWTPELSPHTWGKPDSGARSAPGLGAIPTRVGQRRNPAINYTDVRAIPTYVGQTHQCSQDDDYVQSYPHACGANSRSSLTMRLRKELSPRMWGKQRSRLEGRRAMRAIPTHVGQILLYLQKLRSTVQFSFNFNEDNPSSRTSHLPQTRNLQPQFK